MKKLIIIVLLSISLVGIRYFFIPHTPGQNAQLTSAEIRIALFTPALHPALEEVEQGFKETVCSLSPKAYSFNTFNAQGNRTLLRAQAEEIVGGTYDLICTIGATCSQTVAELLKKKGIHTPHIFCAVDGLEYAQSLRANGSSTGVYVTMDYKQEMDILHTLKPQVKNILLVYDPTHGTGLEKYKKEIEEHIKKFGTVLHSVEIYNTHEIQQKVGALLPTMDVVLVLTDNTIVAGIDALIVLCNRYGVTLVASDLASGKKGAALAYGITEYESGSSAAHKAHAVLVDGKKPHELPITAVNNFRLEINKNTMAAQKLEINNEILRQIQFRNKHD